MRLDVERTYRERARLFVVIAILGAFISAGAIFRFGHAGAESDNARYVMFAACALLGVLGACAADRMVGVSIRELRVARLGTTEERIHLLASERPGFEDPRIRAIVAIEAQDLSTASGLLAESEHTSKTPQEELAQLRYDLARGDDAKRAAIVRALVEWRASSGGLLGVELERYRAFVLACALERSEERALLESAVRRLGTSRDEHIRGYRAWFAFHEGIEIPADALPLGAILARHHGRDELARELDALATRARMPKSVAPYRA